MNRRLTEISERNLRQQLNPEFILNTLNSIQYALFSNNKNVSQLNLSHFAKFMRLILENSQHKYISLHKEIDTVKHYLELEVYRHNEKFDFEIIIDNNYRVGVFKCQTVRIRSFNFMCSCFDKSTKMFHKVKLRIISNCLCCPLN